MKRSKHPGKQQKKEREEVSMERCYMLPEDVRCLLDVLEQRKGIMPHTNAELTLSWRLAYLVPWYRGHEGRSKQTELLPWRPLKRPEKQEKYDWPLAGLDEGAGSPDRDFKPRFGEKRTLDVSVPPHSAIVQSLQKQDYLVETFTLRTDWRLVVGLGAAHVAETAMTIHRIYSVPYIPGSALKGITRDWAGQQMKNGASAFWNEKTFVLAFGSPHNEPQSPKNRGVALFFDAFPKGGFTIRVDVMTPHFKDYYEGKQMDLGNKKVPTPPADWLSPTPIEFLTVEDTEFEFLIAVDAYRLKRLQDAEKAHENLDAQTLLDEVKKALESALRERGVGAKTRLGYGLFKE